MPTFAFDGAELRRRRLALGLKREHVAIATNRTAESITSWELGRQVPPTPVVMALCHVLDCEPADLFRVDDDLDQIAEAHRVASRRAQGLPDTITDPGALDAAAELLAGK